MHRWEEQSRHRDRQDEIARAVREVGLPRLVTIFASVTGGPCQRTGHNAGRRRLASIGWRSIEYLEQLYRVLSRVCYLAAQLGWEQRGAEVRPLPVPLRSACEQVRDPPAKRLW